MVVCDTLLEVQTHVLTRILQLLLNPHRILALATNDGAHPTRAMQQKCAYQLACTLVIHGAHHRHT